MKLSSLLHITLVGFAALALAPVARANEPANGVTGTNQAERQLHEFEHAPDFDHDDGQPADDFNDGGNWDEGAPDGENENGEFGPSDQAFGGFDWGDDHGDDHGDDNGFPGGDWEGGGWEGGPDGNRRNLRTG